MAQSKASMLKSLALAVATFASVPVMGTAQAGPGARMSGRETSGRVKETGKRLSPQLRAQQLKLRANKAPKKTELRADKAAKPKARGKFSDITLKRGVINETAEQKPGIRMRKATPPPQPGIRMTPQAPAK